MTRSSVRSIPSPFLWSSSTLSSLASVVSRSGPKTRMSSRYTKHSDQAIPRSTLSISLSNVAGGLHQPERHYPKFIEPPLRDEGCLFSVRGVHLHLPVSTSQVEATEKPCTAEGVEAVLNVWERVGVYLRNLIESSIVNTKPRRTAPRTVALLDNPDSQHVFNELPFLVSASRWVASNSLFKSLADRLCVFGVVLCRSALDRPFLLRTIAGVPP